MGQGASSLLQGDSLSLELVLQSFALSHVVDADQHGFRLCHSILHKQARSLQLGHLDPKQTHLREKSVANAWA